MPEGQDPQQPSAFDQFMAQQAQANQAMLAQMQQMQRDQQAIAQALRQPPSREPTRPAVRQPDARQSQKAIEELVEDPHGVFDRFGNNLLSKAQELAEQIADKRLTQVEARLQAERTRAAFYSQNQDLAAYDAWVAGLVQGMPQDWSIERRLDEAAKAIRGHLSQRDQWAAQEHTRQARRGMAAAAPGGPASAYDGEGASGVEQPVDEMAERQAAVAEMKDWHAKRRRPVPREAYAPSRRVAAR